MNSGTNEIGDREMENEPTGVGSRSNITRNNWKQTGDPCLAVIETVAAATNRTITDLPPLHGAIEADALEELVTYEHSDVAVSFRYANTDIEVHGDGGVEVRTADSV